MNLLVTEKTDYVLMSFQNELGFDDMNDFEDQVNRFLEQEKNIIFLDCSKIGFMASSDLGILIQSYNRCKTSGGSFKIFGTTSFVHKLIKRTNLEVVFPYYRTENDAAISLKQAKKPVLRPSNNPRITDEDF